MAYIQATFFAKSMRRQVSFDAFIPKEELSIPGAPPGARPPMKTIYLLHGFTGICGDWGFGSRVQELSMRYNAAVILPSGENSFYLDDVEKGELFGEYVGRELVEFTRSLFGLSSRREDSYIGGFSMGGFGAIRNGLKYHETFGGVVALSSALIVKQVSAMKPGYTSPIADYGYYRRVFGEPEAVLGSDADPEALVERLKRDGADFPRIFMACGTEDFLLAENRDFHECLLRQGVPHEYREEEGQHDFRFWDRQLELALRWMRAPGE
jgi:putative tributyrin esterase